MSGEFHEDTPVNRPEHVPKDARLFKGKWITLDENGQVVIHHEEAEPAVAQPLYTPVAYPMYPAQVQQDDSELLIKIRARGKALDNLPQVMGNALGMTTPSAALTPYPQAGYPALAPYAQQQPFYPDQVAPYVTPMYYDSPPYEQTTPYTIDPDPPQRQIEAYDNYPDDTTEEDGEEYDDDEDYDYEPRERRKASKKGMALIALLSAGLVAGPTIQAANAHETAVEVCAKDGIATIFANPTCFIDQYTANLSTKNLLNFIPPEQD